jgi:hypothetical protein
MYVCVVSGGVCVSIIMLHRSELSTKFAHNESVQRFAPVVQQPRRSVRYARGERHASAVDVAVGITEAVQLHAYDYTTNARGKRWYSNITM